MGKVPFSPIPLLLPAFNGTPFSFVLLIELFNLSPKAIDYQSASQYLSAMSNELCKMRDEGLLEFEKIDLHYDKGIVDTSISFAIMVVSFNGYFILSPAKQNFSPFWFGFSSEFIHNDLDDRYR